MSIASIIRLLTLDVEKEEALLSETNALFARQLDRIELDLGEIKELLHENIALTRIRRRKKGEPTDDGYIKGHTVDSITVDDVPAELDRDVLYMIAHMARDLGEPVVPHE